MSKEITKEEYLKRYILTRSSYKRDYKELCSEALDTWNYINANRI